MESRQQFIEVIQYLQKPYAEYLDHLFRNCPEKVVQAMQYRKTAKGEVLIQAGSPCDTVYIVLEGHVRGADFYRCGNSYMFLEYFHTEVLGDYELFGDIPEYQVTIYTMTECEIVAIPAKLYLEWMQEDIHALFMRTRSLIHRLAKESVEDRKFLFLDCKDRMALYLVEAFERRGTGNVTGKKRRSWNLQKGSEQMSGRSREVLGSWKKRTCCLLSEEKSGSQMYTTED